MTLAQIQSKIYFLTKTNSTSFTNANMLILLNNAYERVASLIMKCDSRWQWDDNNNTNFPIATTNIVSGQQDYELAVTHLRITKVEMANSSGVFSKLLPFDQTDEESSLTQLSTETGTPTKYDKLSSSLFLYPKPNYDYTNGLKVYFQRGPTLWTSSDLTTGTAQAGFNSLYHDLIPLWVSYEYGLANGLKNTNQIMVEIDRKEQALKADYSMRNKDEKPRLIPRVESCK